MRRYLLLLVVLALTMLVYAQTRSARPSPKPKAQASAGQNSGLPSKATVDSFLRHVFGWDKDLQLTVTSIAPSAAPGIAEIKVDLKTPQKSSVQKLYVLPDQKHALHGEMYPFASEPGASKPSDTAINAFVRQMTQNNPTITWSIVENKPDEMLNGLTRVLVVLTTAQGKGPAQFYVTRDGVHALVGEVTPFGADPYAAARAELARGMNGPSRGPANAPVTIVEFGDLQCPACKAAMPTIERLLSDEPKTRFVFQQFPLTQIHKWAFKAATFGDCVARESNPAFWKFVQNVYANQEQINEGNAEQKLTEAATQAGVDGQRTASCAALPGTAARINQSMDLGKAMAVAATPTLFVAGRQISNVSGMPYDSLKKMTEFMGAVSGKQQAASGRKQVAKSK